MSDTIGAIVAVTFFCLILIVMIYSNIETKIPTHKKLRYWQKQADDWRREYYDLKKELDAKTSAQTVSLNESPEWEIKSNTHDEPSELEKDRQIEELKDRIIGLESVQTYYKNKIAKLEEENQKSNAEPQPLRPLSFQDQAKIKHLIQFEKQAQIITDSVNQAFEKQYDVPSFFDSITTGRLNNAFQKDLQIDQIRISATVHSQPKSYKVSLYECNCYDFMKYEKPCKHMLALAYTFGLLQHYHANKESEKNKDFNSDIRMISKKGNV